MGHALFVKTKLFNHVIIFLFVFYQSLARKHINLIQKIEKIIHINKMPINNIKFKSVLLYIS